MENISLGSSPKLVFGLTQNPRSSIFSSPLPGFPKKFSSNSKPRKASPSTSFLVFASLQGPKFSKPIEKLRRDCFASIFSSGGKQTSSVGENPPIPVQSTNSPVGSPLFWIGVGVAFSALFSWVANYLKKYAMQQAFKTLMGQMNTPNNQFNSAGFPPSSSPFPFTPQFGSATSTPPPPTASKSVTVDVSANTVKEPPKESVKADSETKQEQKKYAFVDVPPEETFQKSSFEKYKEPTADDPPKYVAEPVSHNGAAVKVDEGSPQGSSSTGNTNPLLSVDALEKMMEDPTVQKMVYPYLPEEMRDPATFKWMLENPMYRKQLQDMLNNMGGSPEWDGRMMDTLKNFDLNSPEVKQQFDQIGLSPEEVISKIMANPDVAMAFQNPRVQAAIMDCSQNPLSIAKYQNDKEVMDVFNKISELFPGATGSF